MPYKNDLIHFLLWFPRYLSTKIANFSETGFCLTFFIKLVQLIPEPLFYMKVARTKLQTIKNFPKINPYLRECLLHFKCLKILFDGAGQHQCLDSLTRASHLTTLGLVGFAARPALGGMCEVDAVLLLAGLVKVMRHLV